MKIKYILRDAEAQLKRASSQFPALALTGARQTGKSTMLRRLFRNHEYVTFDDPLMRERASSDPYSFLKNGAENMIVDEIQYVPQLLSYVKILIDEKRGKNGRFIFTGSQQFHLIKELGDSLAGRIALFELSPFSVEEKKRALPQKLFASPESYFSHACLRGSYPELVVRRNIDAPAWYGSYLQTYLERDVRTVYDIGNLTDFQRFLRLLAGRCSQILHMSALAVDTGVSVNTIKRWLSILEASRIIFLLQPYYRNFGKRIVKSPKLYFSDCGLLCHLLAIKDRDFLMHGPLAGPLFENFCVQETFKRLAGSGLRPSLYYIRTANGLEIDILLERNGRIFPVECKLSRTPRQEMARPIERLKGIFPKWDVADGTLLSLSKTNMPLSQSVSVRSFDGYLAWLRENF